MLTPSKTSSAGEKIAHSFVKWKAGTKKWHKQKCNRKFRRWAKLDPENAPMKMPIRGWID